jgi:hypothetical protein
MTRGRDRLEDCDAEQARRRLQQAEMYLGVAERVLAEEPGEGTTVATGNAVLAAIAAADAICCAAAGSRYRGSDHRRAVDHLETVTGDKKLAALLRDVIDLKNASHYGVASVAASRAKSAIRKSAALVEAARSRVR